MCVHEGVCVCVLEKASQDNVFQTAWIPVSSLLTLSVWDTRDDRGPWNSRKLGILPH